MMVERARKEKEKGKKVIMTDKRIEGMEWW